MLYSHAVLVTSKLMAVVEIKVYVDPYYANFAIINISVFNL